MEIRNLDKRPTKYWSAIRPPSEKITHMQAEKIRKDTHSYKKIAKKYNVSYETIYAIKTRKYYGE